MLCFLWRVIEVAGGDVSTEGFGRECISLQFALLCVYQGLGHVSVCAFIMAICVVLARYCGADGTRAACGNIHVYCVLVSWWVIGVVCGG